MFNAFIKLITISLILILVITALNISNQAINSLTMENRGPILAININIDETKFNLYFLGESYVYYGDKLLKNITLAGDFTHLVYKKISGHIIKIWNIFEVVFLSKY